MLHAVIYPLPCAMLQLHGLVVVAQNIPLIHQRMPPVHEGRSKRAAFFCSICMESRRRSSQLIRPYHPAFIGTLWNGIDPNLVFVVRFRATEAGDHEISQAGCKTLELELIYMGGLLGKRLRFSMQIGGEMVRFERP